jgi:transposase
LHRLTCPRCGATTCGTRPEGVPTGRFSPYTQAILATLAGAYRLSQRQIQRLTADLFGLTISTGMISKLEGQSAAALAEPYRELAESVLEAEAVHIGETG